MKLTCPQSDLSKGLATVGHALSSRSTLPILSCIRLETDQGRLKLCTTNLEMGITCWLDATIEEEGAIALPARLLIDFVASLPPGPVTFTVSAEAFTAQIKGLRSSANMRGSDPSEFPNLASDMEVTPAYRFEAAQVKEVIGQVAFAAASDDTRPVLTAILLRHSDEQVTFAAADSFQLAVCSLTHQAGEEREAGQPLGDLLIPAKTLTELARILPAEGLVDVLVTPNGSQAIFRTESLELLTRLIEGNYPSYTQLIPETSEARAVVETTEFRAALKAVAPFARDSAHIARLRICPGSEQEPGALIIEASSADLGDTISTVPASIEGPEMALAFNATYLQGILTAVSTPAVALSGISASKPGMFTPVGGPNATYILMPMHINR